MELRFVRRCAWQVPVISPCESYPKENRSDHGAHDVDSHVLGLLWSSLKVDGDA
jgi:hypothetical protein